MAVRIKIKIESGKGEIETSALINTGFETEQPEILLPIRLAEDLELYPPKPGSILQEYDVVGGKIVLIKSSETVHVRVVVEDRETHPSVAIPLTSDRENEVLISDSLASELKISIEDIKEGLWRFRDEGLEKSRSSSKPQYWI